MFCDATSASVSDRVFIEATNGTAICSECVVVCVSVLHESASQRGEATSPQTGTK
jgi:ATP-dependent protease Clp ATPase subunit